MGIYDVYMGKGVMVPIKDFINKYKSAFMTEINKGKDYYLDIFNTIVIANFGEQFSISGLGHDAFNCRDSPVLPSANFQVYEDVIKPNLDQNPYDIFQIDICYSNNSVIFIGYYESMNDNDDNNAGFGWYLKTPELLYSIPGLIENIISIRAKCEQMDFTKLSEEFDQPALYWTFSPDCHCCG